MYSPSIARSYKSPSIARPEPIFRETYLPAAQPPTQTHAWLSRAHVHEKRPPRPCLAPPQGAQEAHARLVLIVIDASLHEPAPPPRIHAGDAARRHSIDARPHRLRLRAALTGVDGFESGHYRNQESRLSGRAQPHQAPLQGDSPNGAGGAAATVVRHPMQAACGGDRLSRTAAAADRRDGASRTAAKTNRMSPDGALIALIRAYQRIISPLLPGGTCRFAPTCSEYSAQAIGKYGALRGVVLTAKRLCRCGPWHPGGFDPVP